jgi:hypothetical protein
MIGRDMEGTAKARFSRRFRLSIAVAIVLFLLIFPGVYLLDAFLGRPLAFNQSGWTSGSGRVRWRMAQDPQLRQRLLGLSQESVTALLGQPDNQGKVNRPPPDELYFYRIDRPLDPFRWNLVVSFENGRVTNVEISD